MHQSAFGVEPPVIVTVKPIILYLVGKSVAVISFRQLQWRNNGFVAQVSINPASKTQKYGGQSALRKGSWHLFLNIYLRP